MVNKAAHVARIKADDYFSEYVFDRSNLSVARNLVDAGRWYEGALISIIKLNEYTYASGYN